MSGQISFAIPVGDSFPAYFTLDNATTLLVVSFIFEDAGGTPIIPVAGSRSTRLRFRMAGYLPDPPEPYIQIRYEEREGNPPAIEIPAIGSGTYNLGGLSSLISLVSTEVAPTPGAVQYRYFISANPLGGQNS